MIYLELFLTFFLIGLFTFGGGYAMLPLIQEQVIAKGWMSAEQITNFVAVSESTPGPFAINIATYIGATIAPNRILGSICTTLGTVLPSFIVILIVAQIYEKFKKSRLVSGAMNGLRPAVVGLIASAVWTMAGDVLFATGFNLATITSYWFIVSIIIFVPCVILVFKKAHPILVVGISAAAGIAAGLLEPLIMK